MSVNDRIDCTVSVVTSEVTILVLKFSSLSGSIFILMFEVHSSVCWWSVEATSHNVTLVFIVEWSVDYLLLIVTYRKVLYTVKTTLLLERCLTQNYRVLYFKMGTCSVLDYFLQYTYSINKHFIWCYFAQNNTWKNSALII